MNQRFGVGSRKNKPCFEYYTDSGLSALREPKGILSLWVKLELGL